MNEPLDPGVVYLIVAFTTVWLVTFGYMAYLALRARAVRRALSDAAPNALPTTPSSPEPVSVRSEQ